MVNVLFYLYFNTQNLINFTLFVLKLRLFSNIRNNRKIQNLIMYIILVPHNKTIQNITFIELLKLKEN